MVNMWKEKVEGQGNKKAKDLNYVGERRRNVSFYCRLFRNLVLHSFKI